MIHIEIDPTVPATLGIVSAAGIEPGFHSDELESELARTLDARRGDLPADAEAARLAARDMLRTGKYKPTGRGKPASEYLLRAATTGEFPRINGPVDVCNVVSLASMLPVSVWDVDRAGSERYLLRHGRPGESYVFNTAGQTIELEDLLLCAAVSDEREGGDPIVNPVKDSMATKTNDGSKRVCAVIYAPRVGFEDWLQVAVDRFASLIATCGPLVEVHSAVARPGESAEV